MPRVPTYTERGGVAPAALPNVRVSTNVPVVNTPVPDLTGIARVGMQLAERARERADQIALMEGESQLAALETDLLYNPETGVMIRQGKESFDAPTVVSDGWTTGLSKIAATM